TEPPQTTGGPPSREPPSICCLGGPRDESSKDSRCMRRMRKDATKVWHNPELNTFSRRGGGNGGVARPPVEAPEDRRASKQHRAALEALFAPKREEAPASPEC